MPKYIKAKQEFLTWLSEQAEEQNTELTINGKSRGYYREPDVLARLRATTKSVRFQTRNTNDDLSVSDELNSRFDQVLCVILQLSDPPGFNPQSDHFYPLRVNTIQRSTGKQHTSGEFQLNLDLTSDTANHFRDDLTFALGPQTTDNTQIGPSGSSPLQDLARDVCRDTDPDNE